jgi:parallel beta-helix repeat protein
MIGAAARIAVWPCIVTVLASAATARTLEVDPAGDDRGPGTPSQPLRTIGQALRRATAGDTVLIHTGTYREGPLTLRQGGTPDQPLTLQSAPGAEVILKGSDPVTNWQDAGHGTWRRADWRVNSQQLFVDGTPLQQIGVQSPWHTHAVNDGKVALPPVGKDLTDVTPGTFLYDAPTRTLTCMLPDRSDPNRHLMEASVRDSLLDGEDKTNVVIRGLTFLHSNGTAKGHWAALLRVMGGNGWQIEDCTFAWGDFAGATFAGDGHTVRRCRFIHNGDEGLGLSGSDAAHAYKRYRDRPPQNIVFEDLTVAHNNYRRFYEHWHAGGMKLIPAIRAVTVRRCTVADNWGPGIWFDGALGENIVEDNVVVRNRTGIFYEVSEPSEGDRFGIRIRNNRVASNANQGIYISASSGARVESNTCFRNAWDIVLHGMPRRDFGYDMWLRDNVVRDNILHGRDADVIAFVGAGATHNTIDGNFYAMGPAQHDPSKIARNRIAFSATTGDYSVTHRDLPALSAEQGFELTGLAGDPQWVNANELDFRLRTGSPAAGRGWQQKEGDIP